MKILLIAYMAAYALVMGGMLLIYVFFLPAEEKKDDRWWTTPLDVLLAVVTFAGMVLLLTDTASTPIKMAWRVIAPALVTIQLYLNVRARAKYMHGTGDTPDAHSRAADLGILLFVAPALALNLIYAFK